MTNLVICVIAQILTEAYKRQHLCGYPNSSWKGFISPFLVSRDLR